MTEAKLRFTVKVDVSKVTSQIAKMLQDMAYDTYRYNIQYSKDLDAMYGSRAGWR